MKNKTRKKINRTGKAACGVCKRQSILEEHHIRGRKIPNANHSSNLCYICGNCHNEVHAGLLIIEDWLTTSAGKELIWHKNTEQSLTGRDAKPHLVGKKRN